MRVSYAGMLAFLLLGSWGRQTEAACTAPACTKVIDNGPDAGKKVAVVMGDGYTAGDQSSYNTRVTELVTDGLYGNDFFNEEHNGFNVYRLNLNSAQSGVSKRVYDEHGTPTDSSDDTIVSTTTKNTALKYIFSGSWAHCWLEHTSSGGTDQTDAAKNAALAANGLSHADYIIVVLNDPGFGGCNRGPRDIVQTHGVSWQVLAHEAGHGIGGLMDEYSNVASPWSGGAVTTRNCSTVLNRNNVLWNRYIDPATAVATTFAAPMDSNRTVGEFEGCGTRQTGIWRPVNNCRMRGNTPNYCPACQTLMRKALYPTVGHDFDNAVVGDFNGDGRDDVLVKNGNDWAIYRASGPTHRLDRVWTANNRVPSAPGSGYYWTLASGDQLHVADFDGDGKDDVYVLNTTSWGVRWLGLLRSNGTGLETVIHYGGTIPGYGSIGASDQVKVADFDGDGKQDIYLFTGSSWGTKYMGLLKSSGTALSTVKRYDGNLPGWIMGAADKYYVADFDGDHKDDLYAFNGTNWGASKYLGMIKSSGAALSDIKLYTNTLASGWNIGAHDQHFVGDIDGDGKDDLYVFNGQDWAFAYMELTKSSGTTLGYAKRYDNEPATAWAPNIPGWIMTKGDRFFISDANKDGKADLFVWNPKINWSTEYLGTLMSSGTALSGSWSEDWVSGISGAGAWNLGNVDKIIPANYEGGAGKAGLVIRNTNWIGLIRRASGGFVMDRHYQHWIYSPLHDSKPWSDTMP